jgi:hypothetical protein
MTVLDDCVKEVDEMIEKLKNEKETIIKTHKATDSHVDIAITGLEYCRKSLETSEHLTCLEVNNESP